ncbi:type III pantothenate kinase [Bythopirellula polymerisocia]|uniref:Type III pantothenate kinase n=1 Tax=Bythopirellula polymerisocia TaxID=2528003 RepID=A0A5C6D0B5_9BACT|nr:type III pantothenate kinase [Bythopirellula polymerisocia]TWU30342.1 Type III pantothenate kinase [Bythopirellula polymerisocia]
MSEVLDLLAVDVGTSRVKFGWFPGEVICATEPPESLLPIAAPKLAEPAETFSCQHRGVPVGEFNAQITEWLSQCEDRRPQVALASVNPAAAGVVEKLFSQLSYPAVRVLTGSDLPIVLQVKEPQRVGIDRLLNAVAVNRIRKTEQPAIVMDLGTAVTVDLIGSNGDFLGGAILPGWSLSASALHGAASSLPLLSPDNLQLPEHGLGKCTTEAMAAGLTWGLVGALEKLIAMYSEFSHSKPQLFLTGGNAPLLLESLNESVGPVRHVSHLVLAGIALACEGSR